uniref:Uncharacterized protein n=1 Tax=Anopheles arabiensis TaxID=7173 RepID=A0A182HPG8_ANOAR
DWNPAVQGFLVLKRIPSTVRVLRVENLLYSTVDENLIEQFVPSLKVLVVEGSYDVQSLSIPSTSRLESVLIRNTLISKMYFEENDELKTLLIVNSHLSEIPPSLKNLTSLNILTIRGSNISVVDLSLVSRMKMLIDLVIDESKISSFAPHSQAITQSVLKHIKLRHNLLKSINFDELKPFGMLQTFDITHNSVSTSTGSVSNSLLQRLNWGNNDLAYFFFCGWTELSNVSYLAVPNNQLLHVPNCLATFPNIISLDFSFNRIRSVEMLTFVGLNRLRVVNLEDGTFLSEASRSLRGIIVDKSSAVKSLFVSKNSTIQIIKIIESQLNKLHFERNYALQQVLIAKCNLKEIPTSVHNLINLESFTIAEAFIMTVDLNYFIGLACLNTLQVEMNSVNSVIGLMLQTNSTDLTTLKLWHNQLTTFQFDLVKPFQKLHTLDIAHNVIRSVVGNLTNQSLRYFAIQHNLVSKLDFCSWNEIASLEWLSIGHNRL